MIKKTTRAMPKCPPENLGFGKVLTDHMLKIKWSKAHGWHAPEITPAAPIPLHPFSHVFHYAQEVRGGTGGASARALSRPASPGGGTDWRAPPLCIARGRNAPRPLARRSATRG